MDHDLGVDLSGLDQSIENICAELDRVRAQRDALLAALRRVLPFIDDASDVQQFYPDSAASSECRAAIRDITAAMAKAENGD